jgi:hypothetical protein
MSIFIRNPASYASLKTADAAFIGTPMAVIRSRINMAVIRSRINMAVIRSRINMAVIRSRIKDEMADPFSLENPLLFLISPEEKIMGKPP